LKGQGNKASLGE
jgi:hypothetical protein